MDVLVPRPLTPRLQGLLIDLDGVLYVDQKPIDGAVETVRALRQQGVPCRFLTNTSTVGRSGIASKLVAMGFDVPEHEIFSAPMAAVALLRQQAHARCKLCVAPALRPEFDGIALTGTRPTHIVIGDIGATWTFDLLNDLLQDVLQGAELVAIHKNRFWQTAQGLRMDIGAFVAALEYAGHTTARVVGKPSADFFDQAVLDLGLDKPSVAVIGDDIDTDVLGAQRAGLRGVLCRTGKYREAYTKASGIQPDAIIDSIRDLPRLLESLGNLGAS